MKRIIAFLLTLMLIVSLIGCSKDQKDNKVSTTEVTTETTGTTLEVSNDTETDTALDIYLDAAYSTQERVADLLGKMTLEDKAAQMVQGALYAVQPSDLENFPLGSILSGGGGVPGKGTLPEWDAMMKGYQDALLTRELKIPMLYGVDAVHGNSNVKNAVIFPHNVGLGAANDPELVRTMGKMVADEMELTKVIWNFSPCVAIANDPRWGRTYESFSTDPEIVSSLAKAYMEGQQEAGIVVTAKHYLADGGTKFGTGTNVGGMLDRGDAQMTEEELRSTYLVPYKELVGAGVDVVMASFSSFNGEPMHANKYLLTDVLKTELGFEGFVVSDWEAIHLFEAESFNDQVQMAINAGIDMLMEPTEWPASIEAIIQGVNDGIISQERVDDAVSRILTVKFDAGLFEDPYLTATGTKATELGSQEYRDVAAELVSESLVLLKNEGNTLPLQKGQKVFVTGPAANNIGMQCGGWTIQWQGLLDKGGNKITPGTTILEGLEAYADEYGLEIITDESRASEADVVILALGELPYSEWEGDTPDLSIVGALGSPANQEAIDFVKTLDKPIVTTIVAGRNVLIDEFMNDWDSVVMCYLPGTQGEGVAPVLLGEKNFTGKLAMPWYKDVEDIGTQNPDLLFDLGYGLEY